MRILLLAVAVLFSLFEIAVAQAPGQGGTMQAPDTTRRPRQRTPEAPQQAAPATVDPRIAEVEQYFNSIRTLKARFVQNNPNGSVGNGTLYIRRPGRMRFEYDTSKLKIVADGSQVTMWNTDTRDFGQWPIGWTAASFLVKEPLKLSGDLNVERIEEANGLLNVTMSQARKPQEGRVIVRLAQNPMQLRGWSIIDGRGQRVDVGLSSVQLGAQLADSLFRFDGPDPSTLQRN